MEVRGLSNSGVNYTRLQWETSYRVQNFGFSSCAFHFIPFTPFYPFDNHLFDTYLKQAMICLFFFVVVAHRGCSYRNAGLCERTSTRIPCHDDLKSCACRATVR